MKAGFFKRENILFDTGIGISVKFDIFPLKENSPINMVNLFIKFCK